MYKNDTAETEIYILINPLKPIVTIRVSKSITVQFASVDHVRLSCEQRQFPSTVL